VLQERIRYQIFLYLQSRKQNRFPWGDHIKDISNQYYSDVAVGDALGVSAEFSSREELRAHPVTGMAGYGKPWPASRYLALTTAHLTFCLAEALTEGFDLKAIGQNFVRWRQEGSGLPAEECLNIGGTTARLSPGWHPE